MRCNNITRDIIMIEKEGKILGIGFRFGDHDTGGVVLQSCKALPKHHNREDEEGPFYGVHYENGEYIWYSKKQLKKIIGKDSV